jgi:futalosine hydrolase
MEGAAFYFVCNGFSVDCLQLRAVSNKVERRNREAWDLPKAMDKLAVAVSGLLQALPGHA